MACSVRVALKTPNQKERSGTARKSRAASLPGFNNQNQTMKHKLKYYGFSLLTAAAAMFVALPASAQQITGDPSVARATEVISGKQIPARR
jgi:hypothetical protein